ncbi:MAG: hypothetical protein ATN33_01225 [Epulopiscium sp. Nele67-Bin001]|nr:MAG: hypothetical protein ATN33_01225 [Epulopiscium sp. Nele67-Bin001]
MTLFEFDKIAKLVDEGTVYTDMLKTMKEEALSFARVFKDTPEITSDWGHNYFCADDGERLIFDLNKPHDHECMLCGKVYKSEKLDNVWVYFYRNQAILTLMKLAVVYKLEKDPECLELYKKILTYYAEHYTEFKIHAKDVISDDLTYDVGGAGRMMPQGLNEAIVLIRISVTLEILKDDLDKEFKDLVINNLFMEAVKILKPQLIRIHNIPCWLNSAIGVVALVAQNQELIDLVFDGDFSINEQLKQGVTADKFWYEGSIHYNFFLLEGVTSLLIFAKIYDKEVREAKIVEEMLIQAYHYALDNDTLPNPNDGWPNVNLKTYEYIYCMGAKVFGIDSPVGNVYKNILARDVERVTIPLSKPYYYNNDISFERLIYFPDLDVENRTPIERGSVSFKHSYYGLLRNDDINAFVKYGHLGPSHAHPDKMTTEILIKGNILSRDLSNSGYGARLCDEWHRISLSHNTVVVDGKNHTNVDGGILNEFNENRCYTHVDNVYEGVHYTRELDLLPDGFLDKFLVQSDDEHNYDWIFHSQAKLLTQLNLEDADLGYSDNGYQHVQNTKLVVTDNNDSIDLEWDLNGVKLISTIKLAGKQLFLADTFDNPVSHYRKAIILREKAKDATFEVNWKIVN